MRDGVLWLYVGAQAVQVAQRSGQRWVEASFREAEVQWADVDSLQGGLHRLASEMKSAGGAPRRGRLCVVVSDHWLAAAPVPWSDALLRRDTALMAARDHLNAWGHEPGDADDIWLDDPGAGQPRLAVAVPAALLDALDAFSREVDAGGLDVVPLSVLVAERLGRAQSRAGGWTAILEPARGSLGRSVTFVASDPRAGRIEQVITRNLGLDAAPSWSGVEQALQRVSWSGAQASGMACAVVDAESGGLAAESMPPNWVRVDWRSAGASADVGGWLAWLAGAGWPSTALAASRTRPASGAPRSSAAAARWQPWQAAAIGVLVVLTAYGAWLDVAHVSRLQRLATEGAARASTAAAKRPATTVGRERITAVNAVIHRLNLPLDAVLSALQPPKDLRVGLLALEASGAASGAPSLKITAEAPSFGDMTRYVGYLAASKAFTQAELVRHEAAAGANGLTVYRFSVEAAWRP